VPRPPAENRCPKRPTRRSGRRSRRSTRDPRNELTVGDLIAGDLITGTAEFGALVATCQLTFTPGLSRGGAERMTIEAVRVRADARGRGVGRQLMAYAVARARDRNCRIVQLTTDKRRTDAQRFYASLGFVNSHEGIKLQL
jgi:GNAT superfamily N-acetyltransferase